MAIVTQKQKDEAVRDYQERRGSVREICRRHGLSQQAFYDELERRQLPKRTDPPGKESVQENAPPSVPQQEGTDVLPETKRKDVPEHVLVTRSGVPPEGVPYLEETPKNAVRWEPPPKNVPEERSDQNASQQEGTVQGTSAQVVPVPFTCPGCRVRLELETKEEQTPGFTFPCPKCGRKLRVEA